MQFVCRPEMHFYSTTISFYLLNFCFVIQTQGVSKCLMQRYDGTSRVFLSKNKMQPVLIFCNNSFYETDNFVLFDTKTVIS